MRKHHVRQTFALPGLTLSRSRQRDIANLLLFAVLIVPTAMAQNQTSETRRKSDFSASDISAAQQFTQTLGVADWLGPLAPVALSPFFGIACLSGMSLYGGNWISADNAFLGDYSPLHNSGVFYVFLGLSLLTSVPRLTKVSKPFAQAVDQIEAWAGIITLLTIKLMMATEAQEVPGVAMVQLGIVSFTVDTLLLIAAAMNVFVINAVKFFFEVLIWITPIPTIDAAFEVANKSTCAVLMAIYGYSPALATIINLCLFVVAAFLFRWIYRREVFFRTVLLDAVLAFFQPKNSVAPAQLYVFPSAAIGPFAARSRCRLQRGSHGWTLTMPRILRTDLVIELPAEECRMELTCGYFTNTLKITGNQPVELSFSRRYNECLPLLAKNFGAEFDVPESAAPAGINKLKIELT